MAQSRREQLQAYRFMQRRVRTALLDADPDTNDAPLSRMGAATYAGIMIAILVLAGAGIFGIIDRGGSTAWKKAGTLIIERESDTPYVYINGVLYQVQNRTSAQLILGTGLSTLDVSHNSLRGTKHGGIIGIRGAAQSVPAAKQIVGATWSVCSAGDLTVRTPVPTQIQPGITAAGAPLRGMLLRAPQGTFLLAQNHVYLIPPRWLTSLRYLPSTPGVEVTNDFIASIPRGQTLQPQIVPGQGRPGVKVGINGKTRIGQVLQDNSQRNQYYLVLANGLAPLTPLQSTLQRAVRSVQAIDGGTRPISIDSDALTGIATNRPLPQPVPLAQRAPSTRPAPVTPSTDGQVCVIYPSAASATPTVVYGRDVPVPYTAGLVRLPLGSGAVVQSSSAAAGSDNGLYFISDGGVEFPIGADALTKLGLDSVPRARVSSAVLGAIPAGPALTEKAALTLSGGGQVTAPK